MMKLMNYSAQKSLDRPKPPKIDPVSPALRGSETAESPARWIVRLEEIWGRPRAKREQYKRTAQQQAE